MSGIVHFILFYLFIFYFINPEVFYYLSNEHMYIDPKWNTD
jgi:hypothetical protein